MAQPRDKRFEDKYKLTGQILGNGSLAVVLGAERKSNGLPCAAKKLKIPRGFNKQQREELRKEQRIMELLDQQHPKGGDRRVAQLIDSFWSGDGAWLVMTPLAEGSLRDVLDDARENYGSSLNFRSFMDDLALGLDFIHKASVRHKDIKPENILVDKGRLLYADFGISYEARSGSATTNSTSPTGTWHYSPPEVKIEEYAGEGRGYDSDVFCLGTVFWEILANMQAVSGIRDTCFGNEYFHGYAEMAEDGTLLREFRGTRDWIRRLRQGIENGTPRFQVWSEEQSAFKAYLTSIIRYFGLTLEMLEVHRKARPSVGRVIHDLEEIHRISNNSIQDDSIKSAMTVAMRNML